MTGRALLAMVVDVMRAQAAGQVQIHLQGAALPVPPDGIPQDELELGAVEGALPRIQGVFDAGGPGGVLEGVLRAVPDLIAAHSLAAGGRRT